MKKSILLIIIIVVNSFKSYSCECLHTAVSFAKRIQTSDLIILGEISEYLNDGTIKVKVLEYYSGKMKTDSVYIFNGGATDCIRSFFNDVGTQFIFALDDSGRKYNGQTLYEVPSCIESALLYDKNNDRVKGNITRLNSFISRLYISLHVYKLPHNNFNLDHIENKIIKQVKK